jgi:hypothetical protein
LEAFKLVDKLVAAITVERKGRKKLLYFRISFILQALLVLTFTIGQAMGQDETNPWTMRLLLGAMFLYIGGFADDATSSQTQAPPSASPTAQALLHQRRSRSSRLQSKS